jgi:DNA polymerase III subunit delta'
LGWAVRMHNDETALEERAHKLDDLLMLVSASRVQRFAYAEKLAREGTTDQIQATLDLWVSMWRDVLLASAQASAPFTNLDRATEIQRLAEQLPTAAVHTTLNIIRHTGELLERNVNARLALEMMLLDWPRV